jgi:hypothetical protein
MSATRKFKLPAVLAVAMLAIASFIVAAVAQVQAVTMVQIYGIVYDSQGQTMEDVEVWATAPGESDVLYGTETTASDGAYSLQVAYKSTYDIHFEPPSGSDLNGYVAADYSVVRTSRELNANLTSSQLYTFSGTVTDASGDPVSGLEVRTDSPSSGSETTYTDINGDFTVVRNSDLYAVSLVKADGFVASEYPYFELSQGEIDLSAGDVIQNYQLPAVLEATVTVHDRFGQNAPGQEVQYAVGSTESASAAADSQGVAALPILDGVAIPEGVICSTFDVTNTVTCNELAYDGTANIALELNAPLKHVFAGVITDSDDNPVADINVKLTSQVDGAVVEVTSDQDGNYSIVTDPAVYDITVNDIGSTNATNKKWSTFAIDKGSVDLSAGDVTQPYELPAIRTLHVTVNDNPDNTVKLKVGTPETAPYYSTAAMGSSINLVALEGATIPAGGLCVTYNASNAGSECNPTEIVVGSSNLEHEFTAPLMYTFSGQLLNSDTTPAKGKNVRVLVGGDIMLAAVGKTASYSIRLLPATYDIRLFNNATQTVPGFDIEQGTVDLTAGSLTQNYTVPEYVTVGVTILDFAGNPLPDVSVGVSTPTVWHGPFGTDSNGQAILAVVKGQDLPAGTICVTEFEVCNDSVINTSTSTTLTMQMPEQTPDPEPEPEE